MPQDPAEAVRRHYRTLREIVQQQLEHDILTARFLPGEKLVEAQLSQLYAVSRAPIREALRALEERGLVRFEANRGAVVISLSALDLREIYDMRVELEGLAAQFGAEAIGDQDLKRMRSLLGQMDRSVLSPSDWIMLNNEFHMTLYRASRRSRLCRSILELMNAYVAAGPKPAPKCRQ
jgi:DNA-binding GntR family transcriptional regulator